MVYSMGEHPLRLPNRPADEVNIEFVVKYVDTSNRQRF